MFSTRVPGYIAIARAAKFLYGGSVHGKSAVVIHQLEEVGGVLIQGDLQGELIQGLYAHFAKISNVSPLKAWAFFTGNSV